MLLLNECRIRDAITEIDLSKGQANNEEQEK
jgi:hypothetical protein